MLTDVISFEVRNFADGSTEEFIVPNVEGVYELIAGNRFTRCIQITKQFSFNKTHIPSFILETFAAEYVDEYAREFELDEIDEMVGMF